MSSQSLPERPTESPIKKELGRLAMLNKSYASVTYATQASSGGSYSITSLEKKTKAKTVSQISEPKKKKSSQQTLKEKYEAGKADL